MAHVINHDHTHDSETNATTPSSTSGSSSSEVDLLELDFFELQRRLCFQNETEESTSQGATAAAVEGEFDFGLHQAS